MNDYFYTRTDFERDKTERIKALSSIIAAGVFPYAEDANKRLKEVLDSSYDKYESWICPQYEVSPTPEGTQT